MAHTWLAAAADGDISAGAQAPLFFGAPALAFAVHAAARPLPAQAAKLALQPGPEHPAPTDP